MKHRAFLRADYAAAIKIYHELGALLGEQYFKANIEICRARLSLNKTDGVAAVDVDVVGVIGENTPEKTKKKEKSEKSKKKSKK